MKQTFNCLCGLLLFLAAVLGCGPSTGVQRKSSPDFQVTAKDLAREYIQDKAAADAKYKGKTLAIKGVVDYKMAGTILFDPERGQAIQCFFKNKDESRPLKMGAEVSLIGYCEGYQSGGSLAIGDCAVY